MIAKTVRFREWWALCLVAASAVVLLFGQACRRAEAGGEAGAAATSQPAYSVALTDEQWRARLSREQYDVLRKRATEAPYKNQYYKHSAVGVYACAGCGTVLFESDHKYDSGSGWPAFDRPSHSEAIGTSTDYDQGYARTEVHCARCGGHLGHVFDDGPRQTTGLRYCINSASMSFQPAAAAATQPTARPAE